MRSAAGSKVISPTGPRASSQASAGAAPRSKLIARASAVSAMRTKPPGITCQRPATLFRKIRSVNGRGCKRPWRQTGMLDSVTASCATVDAAVVDGMDQRLALRVVELRAQHAGFVAFVDMRFESLSDHQAAELFDDLFPHVGLAEPPG